ncbi:imelysin family protein [Shimia sp. SDUM112013]|uniref:imelysin family protein n=1 Tax=Shimia sp. SDUM112013 TaxID=3136160 RepID=UPI0032ED8035
MVHIRALFLALFLPALSMADEASPTVSSALKDHILPGYGRLAEQAQALAGTADANCDANSTALRLAYHQTFDAWVAVSHLRFGPSEQHNRAFALAFWPDTRGKTPKALNGLIASEDPAARDAETFKQVSIAARGLYALEYLLYDPTLSVADTADYRCALIQTMTRDIAALAGEMRDDWQKGYAAKLATPSREGPYQSDAEGVQELFKALYTGLIFTRDMRLGRPLGSFDKPRPKRAEAWRSERSLRHVEISLLALRDLAGILATDHPGIAGHLDAAFGYALETANGIESPTFANITEVQGWFELDTLRQSLEAVSEILIEELAPALAVTEGFNALDGD